MSRRGDTRIRLKLIVGPFGLDSVLSTEELFRILVMRSGSKFLL